MYFGKKNYCSVYVDNIDNCYNVEEKAKAVYYIKFVYKLRIIKLKYKMIKGNTLSPAQ